LPGVPEAASRGADPVLAGAWCPIGGSSTVEQRAVEEAARRWDGLQGEPLGLGEQRCPGLPDDPRDGRADDLWVAQCSVALVDRPADQVDDSAAGRCLALLASVQPG
jgi:hypothetical protein